MNRTTKSDSNINNRITVNTKTLMGMLDCGRASAVRIGIDADARIQIGKRVLWNVAKVRSYLDSVDSQ